MMTKAQKTELERLQHLVERMDRRYAADQSMLNVLSRQVELLEKELQDYGYNDDSFNVIRIQAREDCKDV